MTASPPIILFSIVVMALVYSCESRKCPGGENDMWTECGSHCPKTCRQPHPRACILSCKVDTCECKANYVRRESDGKCVKKHECGGPRRRLIYPRG